MARAFRYGGIVAAIELDEHCESADGDWDSRGTGLQGFRGRADPIGWPRIFLSVAAIYLAYVVWISVDTLAVAIILLSAEFFLVSLLVIEVTRMDRSYRGTSTAERYSSLSVAWLLLLLVTTPIVGVTIRFYFIEDSSLTVLSRFAAALMAISLIFYIFFPMLSGQKKRGGKTDRLDGLPRSSHKWSQAIDVVVWVAITLASAVLWALVCQCGAPRTDGSLPYGIFVLAGIGCYAYQSRRRSTIGQRLTRVEVVSARTGRPLGSIHNALRTLVLLLPLFSANILIVTSARTGLNTDSIETDVLAVSAYMLLVFWMVVGTFSLALVRDVHARGQGVLDLMTRSFARHRPVDAWRRRR